MDLAFLLPVLPPVLVDGRRQVDGPAKDRTRCRTAAVAARPMHQNGRHHHHRNHIHHQHPVTSASAGAAAAAAAARGRVLSTHVTPTGGREEGGWGDDGYDDDASGPGGGRRSGRGRGRDGDGDAGKGGDGDAGGHEDGQQRGHAASPLHAAWAAYNRALAAAPLRTKALTAGVLNMAGDAVAQACASGGFADYPDSARLARFAIFGLLVAGPLGHFWFGLLERCVLVTGPPGVLLKTFLDQFCWTPLTLSIFFASMPLMEGHGPEAAMIAVQANLTSALFAGWKVWPLVNCITFGVIPVTQRILFVNSVALFWISFLSFVSNKPPDPTVPNQAVAMIAAADAGHCTSPTQ